MGKDWWDMTDIPHCSTCPHKRITHHGNECKVSSTFLPLPAESLIVYVGCLSHPDARAYLMDPVIKELERRITLRSANYEPQYYLDEGKKSGMEDAISLIKNGVK
jgi:hypothetical protein